MTDVRVRPINEDDVPFLQTLRDDPDDPSPFMTGRLVDPRGAYFRDGKWREGMLYSIVRP